MTDATRADTTFFWLIRNFSDENITIKMFVNRFASQWMVNIRRAPSNFDPDPRSKNFSRWIDRIYACYYK